MPAGLLVIVPVPAPVVLTVSVKVCTAKVAVTVVVALSVTVQVPVPEQLPPLQPVKVEPAAGAAVKVTAVPLEYAAAQVAPQEMPAGLLVIVPVPAPVFETVSVKFCTAKVAVTVVAALSVTVQVPVPEQPPPLQPVKVEPAAGAAVKVTAVPLAYVAAQVAPHEIPAGALVTVPVPAPGHPPPLQPVKVEPAAGAAVKVTAVPVANAVEHVAPQEMPAGLLVTGRAPDLVFVTVSVKVCTAKVAVTVVAALS